MNIAGNTDTTIGSLENCARVNNNDVIDANEATNVDLNADTVPDPDILVFDTTAQGCRRSTTGETPTLLTILGE
jgi:hypothetical protein